MLHVALRIVRDELDHAAISHACLVALGGGDAPVPLEAGGLSRPGGSGLLHDTVDLVLENFCFGETLAVPLFRAMRRGTTHPAAITVLDRVLRDEARHRAFGWDLLDALLEAHGDVVRERISARLGTVVAAFAESYAPPLFDTTPLSAEARAAGLLDADTYRRVFDRTLRGDLRRRFAARGIDVTTP